MPLFEVIALICAAALAAVLALAPKDEPLLSRLLVATLAAIAVLALHDLFT